MSRILFRNILYPAYHWAKRDGVNKAIREVNANQWLATDDALTLQRRKLLSLLMFAAKNVPYYSSMLREFAVTPGASLSLEEFHRLPVLTKEIVRRQLDQMISTDLSGNRLRPNSTGGSTGEPMHFFTDLRSTAYRTAAGVRSDSWTGWRLGEPYTSLWGSPIDRERAASLRGRLHALVMRRQSLSSFDMSEPRLDEYVRKMLRFSPQLFLAYPGPLERFAIHCRNQGVRFPSLKAIVSSAETLWPHQRDLAESTFGVDVYDRYGCREVGQIASECELHDGLHISVDRVFLEIVDEQGNPCIPGQTGRILITDLDNYGMPLIRYDIGDRGILSASHHCACGRGLPKLERVEGRTLDIVRTADGRQVGGTFWTLLLRSRPGLRQFQVVQNSLRGIVINYIRETDFDESILEYFTSRIQEYCGSEFEIEFVETTSIDLGASGKQRLIISNLADNE